MSHREQRSQSGQWRHVDDTDDHEDESWSGTGYAVRRLNRLRQRKPASGRALGAVDADEDERGPRARPAARRRRPGEPEEFRCRHCRQFVVSVPSGGRHRNHCPCCLHSRHVDERMPGDRLSSCGGTMAPVGMFVRSGGEHGLVHRCMECGTVRRNRIAADDDFELVLRLPDLTQDLHDSASSELTAPDQDAAT